jgi:hypothetical protein
LNVAKKLYEQEESISRPLLSPKTC